MDFGKCTNKPNNTKFTNRRSQLVRREARGRGPSNGERSKKPSIGQKNRD